MEFSAILSDLPSGLSRERVRDATTQILLGTVPDVQIGAFLFGLRAKGESSEEIEGIIDSLKSQIVPLDIPGPVLDIVGTGGDRTGAINVSTPASIVARAAGHVTVVKHGNRGASTPTGSADLLEAIGIPLNLTPAAVAEVAKRTGLAFCFAQQFQPALKNMAVARRALQAPTIINLLAPLLNPASPRYQLVGVADRSRMSGSYPAPRI